MSAAELSPARRLEDQTETVIGWSAVVVLLLHGPLDIALTAAAWHLENNPLVLELGLGPWLVAKVLIVLLTAYLYLDVTRDEPDILWPLAVFWLGFLAMMGLLLILPNAIVLLAVIG